MLRKILRYTLVLSFGILHTTHTTSPKKPLCSIITSVYNGDKFIEGFFEDIVRQTIFHQCELIVINANSPGNEEPVILKYCQKYPNIIYIRLSEDPGLYGVWNYGIRIATSDFITNANVDDRRNPSSLERHVLFLKNNPHIDLVYADFYVSSTPNQIFESCIPYTFVSLTGFVDQKCYIMFKSDFSLKTVLYDCTPGPFPLWRKSMHDRFGYFDESFRIAGDLEFWVKAATRGARFKKTAGLSGVFYINPTGLSSGAIPANQARVRQEFLQIAEKYEHLCS